MKINNKVSSFEKIFDMNNCDLTEDICQLFLDFYSVSIEKSSYNVGVNATVNDQRIFVSKFKCYRP